MEKLDLTKILKNCPKGWKFYTSVWGEVEFIGFNNESVDFLFDTIVGNIVNIHINIDGTYCCFGECIIFPSKEQRDWSKFTAPWYNKEMDTNSMSNKDDERLRKTAIAFLKDFVEQGYENAVECIDWLEKQGDLS